MELPTIQIGRKTYYIDQRLSQIRNVANPHDYEPVSPELVDFWLKHNIRKL